jgi:hypothetical protein
MTDKFNKLAQIPIPLIFIDAVWEVATDTSYLPEWWDEAYWNTETQRFVARIDDGLGKMVRKKLTKRQLAEAFLSLENKTHCGGSDIVGDPDSCSADLILQQAVLGEVVYG